MGSVSTTSPQSLAGAQALVYSKGVSKTEWDEVLTTTKNAAKDNTEKSVLGWECHHKHFEQEKPGNPSVPSRTVEQVLLGTASGHRSPPRYPWLGEGSRERAGRGSLEQTPVAAQKSPSDKRAPSHHLQLLAVHTATLLPAAEAQGPVPLQQGAGRTRKSPY